MKINELLDANILELFGLDKLSEEERKRFLDYAINLVLDRAIKQILEELPKEKKEEFLEIMKEGTPDEARTAFLKENVSDLEAIIMEEILIFKNEAMEIASENNW